MRSTITIVLARRNLWRQISSLWKSKATQSWSASLSSEVHRDLAKESWSTVGQEMFPIKEVWDENTMQWNLHRPMIPNMHLYVQSHRKVLHHRHWIRVHSRQHSVPHWYVWMDPDKVSWNSHLQCENKYLNEQKRLAVILESDYYVNASLFTSYINNVIGISDPSQLNPPDFCPNLEAEADTKEEPVHFLSLFLEKPWEQSHYKPSLIFP